MKTEKHKTIPSDLRLAAVLFAGDGYGRAAGHEREGLTRVSYGAFCSQPQKMRTDAQIWLLT